MMTKKSRIIKGITITISVLLVLVLAVVGVLFFPLTGEKHTEIWSADQDFDIAKI